MSGGGRQTGQSKPHGVSQKDAQRSARLAELKRQIAAGKYETPEKLDVMVRRMLADLRGGKSSHEDESGGEPL